MNYYETMYIINSSLEGDEIQHIKKDVLDYMEAEGADIYSKNDWGRTRLAYDIEKQRYGNYIILRYSSKPELIKTLNEKFGLMDAVLSHLCTVLDKEPERIDEEVKAHEERVVAKPPSTDDKTEKEAKEDKKEKVAAVKSEEVSEEAAEKEDKEDKREEVAAVKTEEVSEEASEEVTEKETSDEEKSSDEENVAEKEEINEEEEIEDVLEENEEPA